MLHQQTCYIHCHGTLALVQNEFIMGERDYIRLSKMYPVALPPTNKLCCINKQNYFIAFD